MCRFRCALLTLGLLGLLGCGDPALGRDALEVSSSSEALCEGASLGPRGVAVATGLADTSTLEGMADAEARIAELAATFTTCGDRRGVFAVVYRPITRRAVEAVGAGEFEDPAFGERLIVAFAKRYLDAVHASLSGAGSLPAWRRFDELASNEDVGTLRVVATGVASHLLLDLPSALVDAGAAAANRADYDLFGELLVDETPVLVADLAASFGVDAAPLFDGFFLGDWIDGAFGEDVTRTFVFQTIRLKAWRNRWLMQHGMGPIAKAEMAASFATVDAALAGLDASGVL
ncbi:MAG: hypothetical protein FJ095_16635 [Deltaproteobacteria bacterium]|nr:hypothetical protein [Deltaproteobacteria bacterium]